jgi:uncharacterized membrane protein YgcG
MRSSILLLVLSATVFAGCSSAYKTGQTPDDVYFSPERQRDEYVNVQDKNDASRYYENDENYTDDQYLQMKVHNRVMWSELDDWYNYTPSPSYGYYNTWNWMSPWNPYIAWNYYYNPYCTPVIITSHSSMVYNHPRVFNLNTYNNSLLSNNNYNNPKGSGMYNPSYSNPYSKPVKMVGVGNSNNNAGAGNFLRNIFNGSSNNNSSSSGSVGGRSSGSSGSSGGGGGHSGGGGGGAGVRRF